MGVAATPGSSKLLYVGPEHTMWVPMEIISLYLEFIYKHGRYNNYISLYIICNYY